jgi:hypothetical protein
MIRALIIVSGALWLATALALIRSPWCLMVGCARRYDLMRTCSFFAGLLIAGQAMRWVVFPPWLTGMTDLELMVWAALYSLSCGLAVFTLIVARAYGRGDRF